MVMAQAGRGRALGAVALAAALASLFVPRAVASGVEATATLRDATGAAVGRVILKEEGGAASVKAVVGGLPTGFHGFHVHAVGTCIPPAFTSAGGHLNPAGASHPAHAGDSPVLLVNGDGTGALRFVTDRYAIEDLFDGDGSAFIVHALPDNYANIPTRYAPTPDATTLATGDAGGRLACGVVEEQ
jgi:Cu-Zn family superoxide dismutase